MVGGITTYLLILIQFLSMTSACNKQADNEISFLYAILEENTEAK